MPPRFRSPIIHSGSHFIAIPGDVRKQTDAELNTAFDSRFGPFLDSIDRLEFFAGDIPNNWNGVLDRVIPMVNARPHLELGSWMAGPAGYAEGVVSGLDSGYDNGVKSALYDMPRYFPPVATRGGRLSFLTCDSWPHRISDFGALGNYLPHAARLSTALTGTNNDLKFTAETEGSVGNAIRIRYVVAGASTPLSVSVSGNDITVNVATNGSSQPTSTASQVAGAVAASGPASDLVWSANAGTDNGTGVVTALAYTNLAWGDDGVTYDEQECADALVGYIVTAKDWVLRAGYGRVKIGTSVTMWLPFDGITGYACVYPASCPVDLKTTLDLAVAGLQAAGTTLDYVGVDTPEDMAMTRLETPNITADDWMGRIWDIGELCDSYGIPWGVVQQSMWGENATAYVALNAPPRPWLDGSNVAAVREEIRYASGLRNYQLANRPTSGRFPIVWLDDWFSFPDLLI